MPRTKTLVSLLRRNTSSSNMRRRLALRLRFAVFAPPQAQSQPVPVLGPWPDLHVGELMTKAGLQRTVGARFMVIAPDHRRAATMCRTIPPTISGKARASISRRAGARAKHYRMDHYIVDELQRVLPRIFLRRSHAQGITPLDGRSCALTLHLKHPQRYRSASAFSPIVAPSQLPWGQKALTAYLGSDRAAWQQYDATELVKKQPSAAHILIDQGAADQFLERELQPQRFVAAAESAGQRVTLRMQQGYDLVYSVDVTTITWVEWGLRAKADLQRPKRRSATTGLFSIALLRRYTQQIRRMHRDQHVGCSWRMPRQDLSPIFTDGNCPPEQRARRGCAERHDDLRLDQLQLPP